MGRNCTICGHAQRKDIDVRLLRHENIAGIARDFEGITASSLLRHKDMHLVDALSDVHRAMQAAREEALREVRAKELQDIKTQASNELTTRLGQAKDYFDERKEIREKTFSLLDKAEAAADTKAYGPPSNYLREIREQIKLWAELDGKIAAQPQITIVNNPEWLELQTLIITTLRPYPQAREALINALPQS